MNQIDDVPLRRVGIIVLEDKEFIHAIVLQSGEIDKEVDWACQCFADDEILLSPYLICRQIYDSNKVVEAAALTPSRRLSRSFRALVRKCSASEANGGPMRQSHSRSRDTTIPAYRVPWSVHN